MTGKFLDLFHATLLLDYVDVIVVKSKIFQVRIHEIFYRLSLPT